MSEVPEGRAPVPSRWDDGDTAFGVWISSGSGVIAQLADYAGLDFVAYDCQHAPLDEAGAAEMIRSRIPARARAVVRVSKLDDALIGKVADAGADGVIVPLVDTEQEAKAAVGACRYPPRGRRSFGPSRPDLRDMSRDQLAARVSCYVMAETMLAVRNIDAICQVEGLAGVFVGPRDLAISLGKDDQRKLRTLMQRIKVACDRAGVGFGIAAPSPAEAAYWSSCGARVVTIGTDVIIMQRALGEAIGQARSAVERSATIVRHDRRPQTDAGGPPRRSN